MSPHAINASSVRVKTRDQPAEEAWFHCRVYIQVNYLDRSESKR